MVPYGFYHKGKEMKTLVLAGLSILAVVLIVLGPQTNVIAYQTVTHQVSQQALTLK